MRGQPWPHPPRLGRNFVENCVECRILNFPHLTGSQFVCRFALWVRVTPSTSLRLAYGWHELIGRGRACAVFGRQGPRKRGPYN